MMEILEFLVIDAPSGVGASYRAVDVSRIGKLQGRLDKQHLPAIKNALAIVFD